MNNKGKSSKAEVRARINKLIELIIDGYDTNKILQYVSDKTDWNITERHVWNYLKRANEDLQKVADIKHDRELGIAIKRLNNLYYRSLQDKDLTRCLNIQREINVLLGLKAPVKIDSDSRLKVIVEGV